MCRYLKCERARSLELSGCDDLAEVGMVVRIAAAFGSCVLCIDSGVLVSDLRTAKGSNYWYVAL